MTVIQRAGELVLSSRQTSGSPAAFSIPTGPVRTVVTRSGRRLRGMMACGPFESGLERDAFTLLMTDPRFTSVHPQPFKITYLDDGQNRIHVPDALAVGRKAKVVVEVKDDRRARSEAVLHRTALMKQFFAAEGMHYVLWVGSSIRLQPRLSNARRLYSLAAADLDETLALQAIDLVASRPGISVAEAAERLTLDAITPILITIARKRIAYDRDQPLGKQSRLMPLGRC